MRWIPFVIASFLLVVVQSTAGRAVSFTMGSARLVGPDLVAIFAVFIVLNARFGVDAMIAAWLAGLMVDLTTAAAAGSPTAVGPMAIAYVAAAGVVFRVREAFFRDQLLPQVLLGLIFCLVAHGLWLTLQSARAWSFERYAPSLVTAVYAAAYTGVLTPFVCYALNRVRSWFLTGQAARARRSAAP